YVPSPRSRTMNDVDPAPERYVPSVIAGDGEHRDSSGDSVKVTLKANNAVTSVREICTGTVAHVCTDVTQPVGETAETVLVWAAAADAPSARKNPVVAASTSRGQE